jgi:hypothetical protein
MRTQSIDTPPEIEELVVCAYREMGLAGRVAAYSDLEAGLERVARAGIEHRLGRPVAPDETALRLGALRLDRPTMILVFGWDPEIEGY